ncbi:hypothetical protein [Halorhodospira halochloris]|uniref:hypothetical protein n=1 Tax=Halorhodospira halochloris TaxID=1052 RepID=UPI001EE82F20|nr:hypothetical protein [Halorhodospira halochloris]MCG5548943.1 hypothetical protein [Halorhodospira halochloris]
MPKKTTLSSFKRNLKQWVIRSHKNKPISDFRSSELTAIKALADTNGSSVCLTVPIKKIRTLHDAAFSLGGHSFDPYALTAEQLLKNKNLSYKECFLYLYFKRVQPTNAAQLLDVYNDRLIHAPPMSSVVPWRGKIDITGKRLHRKKRVEGKEQDGWNAMGPLTDRQVAFEHHRLRAILHLLTHKGWDDQHIQNFPNAEVLLKNTKEVFMLRDGNHRLAAASALGYDKVPVIIDSKERIIDDYVVKNSKSVTHNILTVNEAQSILDRVHKGKQPFFIEERWNNFLTGLARKT